MYTIRQVQRKRLKSGGDELLDLPASIRSAAITDTRDAVLDEADQAIGQARYRGPQRLWLTLSAAS